MISHSNGLVHHIIELYSGIKHQYSISDCLSIYLHNCVHVVIYDTTVDVIPLQTCTCICSHFVHKVTVNVQYM